MPRNICINDKTQQNRTFVSQQPCLIPVNRFKWRHCCLYAWITAQQETILCYKSSWLRSLSLSDPAWSQSSLFQKLPVLQSSVNPHINLASQSSIQYTADRPWGASLLSAAQGGSAAESKKQRDPGLQHRAWSGIEDKGLGRDWKWNPVIKKWRAKGNILNYDAIAKNSSRWWNFTPTTAEAEMLHQKQKWKQQTNKCRRCPK